MEGDKTFSFSKIPIRSKIVMGLCFFTQFSSSVAYAIIGPFYPHEAEEKGMSHTLVGCVFSIFELVALITSPIFGNYLTTIGPKFVYTAGTFVSGASSLLFGTLSKCPPGASFLILSLLCRSVIALGYAAIAVTTFAILSNEFPEHVAVLFGVLESVQGIGLMSGPVIGGALYQLGGFGTPFYISGAFTILSGIFIYNLLPPPKESPRREDLSMTTLVKSPFVLVSIANIIIIALAIGFMDSSLSNHLENFGVETGFTGFFFVLMPLSYAIINPFWGYLSDKRNILSPLIVGGLLMVIVAFMFIGPCPWFPFLPNKLWFVCIGLFFAGICYGPVFIPSTKCIVVAALELGFEDNLDTYALTSGLYNFGFSMGAFMGPLLSGFLTDNVGFPMAYTILGLLYFPNAVISLIFFVYRNRRRKHGTKLAGGELNGNYETFRFQPDVSNCQG